MRRALHKAAGGLAAHPWLLLPLIAVPLLWPWTRGFLRTADGHLHLLRLVTLDYHIRHGQLFPRWVPELVMGYGYPVFNFYGPSTYYLAEGLHLLGLNFFAALAGAYIVLALVAAGGMYVLARDLFGREQRWAALVAAGAYLSAPYLVTNIVIRGAIAELGAQALLPWILWSLRRLLLAERPARYVLPLALSLGALACTHNITLLLAPPVLLGYALVVWWQGGRAPRRLAWLAMGGSFALGVSAFFWLPLVAERGYLAELAYELSAKYLGESVWTPGTFLDTTLAYGYTFDVPYQLGLVQVALALAGFLLWRDRRAEGLYLAAVVVVAGLAVGQWALPLWLGHPLPLIVQFPWRLLSLMTPPLALFTGGLVARWRPGRAQAWAALAVLAVLVAAHAPRLDWLETVQTRGVTADLSATAQFESLTSSLGTSSTREFMPRWVEASGLEPYFATTAVPFSLTPRRASAEALAFAVDSAEGGPLRFTTFYFPGWVATLDGAPLATYPSTSMGLLTVDVPPGAHEVRVAWAGTPVQQAGLVISVLALAGLALWAARRPERRGLAALPLALLAAGVLVLVRQPAPVAVQTPPAPVQADGVQLLGVRTEQAAPAHLYIFPYWYITQLQPPSFRAEWQLQDAAGQVLTETVVRPYFGAYDAHNWPAGTLVDDAYRLALPPGLSAGTYTLALRLHRDGAAGAAQPVGTVTLAASVPAASASAPDNLGLQVGDAIRLRGYDLRHNGAPADLSGARPTVARAGDRLLYTLFWQATAPVAISYHSFIHLVDAAGGALVKQDQIPGDVFRAPALWDRWTVQPDEYTVRIPAGAAGGLYWPTVGLYEFETLARLPVTDAAGRPLGDTYRLPPVKVVDRRAPAPQHPAMARLGDVATLLGYDVALPPGGLQPGSTFTLTLYFRSERPTAQDLRRFVHVYDPQRGMAAQQDGQPQQGGNPTWAWVAGETVTDRVTLAVATDAAPGDYTVRVGLYDPQAGGVRLAASDARGNPLPDDQVVLATLTVR